MYQLYNGTNCGNTKGFAVKRIKCTPTLPQNALNWHIFNVKTPRVFMLQYKNSLYGTFCLVLSPCTLLGFF